MKRSLLVQTLLAMATGKKGGGLYPVLEVTITNGTATSVTATLNSTAVNLTYDSTAGVWRGTLKAFGTWTVEASNGEKTVSDTVAVTNVAVYTASLRLGLLPSGYRELEYIEGSGTQWINTGVTFEQNIVYDIKLSSTASDDTRYFGTYGGFLISGKTYGGLGWYAWGTTSLNVYPMILQTPITAHIENGNQIWSGTNGEQTTSIKYGSEIHPVYIFCAQYQGNPYAISKMRLYSLSITSVNGDRNFIPARRESDSAVGLYDSITDTFYTNAGSGTFIAGPEVAA